MRDTYWYTLFSEDVNDPVVETLGNTGDLQARPFCVERSRVSLMVLGVLPLDYIVFRILVKTEDVVKYVLMLCGCRFCRALSSIRFRALRMKLIFAFSGIADWWWTNSGFFAGFFVKFERTFAVFGDCDFEIN